MKICYVNPTVLLKRPIAELSTRFAEKGHDVAVFIPKPLFKPLDDSMHYSKLKNVKIYTYSIINLPFLSSEWPIPITPMFIINLFRIFWNYNIIHIWTYFYISSVNALWMKRILFWNRKTILTMDTFPGFSFDMPGITNVLMKIYGKLFGWLIFRLPNIISLYGVSLIEHGKKIGMPENKAKVIPTGMDLNKFKGKFNNVKKEFGIKDNEAMILFVGLVVPRKGVDIVLNAVEELKNDKKVSSKFRMVIVGGGPDKAKYEKEAEKRGLLDVIIFTGWRRDIKDFYRCSDLFFFPSRGEGLAGVIMEAMAVGLPVVSTNIPCTTDLIDDGKSGFLCNIEETCSDKLKLLIKDKALRKKLGDEAIKKISNLNWENTVEKYVGVYK